MPKVVEDRYLTMRQIADLIGRSYRTVRRWAKDGFFGPPAYIRRSPQWLQSDIVQKIETGQFIRPRRTP